MEVIWTERALEAIARIGEHIAKDNPQAAANWVAHLVHRAEDAAIIPLLGRTVPEFARDDIREIIVRKYRIIYQVTERIAYVLFVFEGHRLLHRSDIEPVEPEDE